MENSKRYVIYPHNGNEEEQPNLTPKDKLVYIAIRRYADDKTLEAFPSYAKLKEDIGAVPRTIKGCVENLEREGYISTRKNGRQIIYKFNNKKKFEPFSYDFLYKKDLTFTEKAYIVATHQYMFEQDNGTKTISYTNKELEEIIHMSDSTISRCNQSLESKGYLEGSNKLTKVFQARELDLMFIEKFKDIDDKVNKNTEDIEYLKRENEQLREEIKALKENRKSNYII